MICVVYKYHIYQSWHAGLLLSQVINTFVEWRCRDKFKDSAGRCNYRWIYLQWGDVTRLKAGSQQPVPARMLGHLRSTGDQKVQRCESRALATQLLRATKQGARRAKVDRHVHAAWRRARRTLASRPSTSKAIVSSLARAKAVYIWGNVKVVSIVVAKETNRCYSKMG